MAQGKKEVKPGIFDHAIWQSDQGKQPFKIPQGVFI
jgi:hypothetical protein